MTPFLFMVVAGFVVFIAVLGFYSTQNLILDARELRRAASLRRSASDPVDQPVA